MPHCILTVENKVEHEVIRKRKAKTMKALYIFPEGKEMQDLEYRA